MKGMPQNDDTEQDQLSCVLQCVAVCCSMLPCVVCCNVFECVLGVYAAKQCFNGSVRLCTLKPLP